MELFSPSKLSTLNKTPPGEPGCLSNLYYLLAAQRSSFLIHHLQFNDIWGSLEFNLFVGSVFSDLYYETALYVKVF